MAEKKKFFIGAAIAFLLLVGGLVLRAFIPIEVLKWVLILFDALFIICLGGFVFAKDYDKAMWCILLILIYFFIGIFLFFP